MKYRKLLLSGEGLSVSHTYKFNSLNDVLLTYVSTRVINDLAICVLCHPFNKPHLKVFAYDIKTNVVCLGVTPVSISNYVSDIHARSYVVPDESIRKVICNVLREVINEML